MNNKKLEESNMELKKRILQFEEEDNKGKFCIHCHQDFVSKFNENVSINAFYNIRNPACITLGN